MESPEVEKISGVDRGVTTSPVRRGETGAEWDTTDEYRRVTLRGHSVNGTSKLGHKRGDT